MQGSSALTVSRACLTVELWGIVYCAYVRPYPLQQYYHECPKLQDHTAISFFFFWGGGFGLQHNEAVSLRAAFRSVSLQPESSVSLKSPGVGWRGLSRLLAWLASFFFCLAWPGTAGLCLSCLGGDRDRNIDIEIDMYSSSV